MVDVLPSDAAFLDLLLERGQLSRADVAGATTMSKPTASEAASRLIAAGLVTELGPAQGRRGRAPQLYELNPAFGTALAIIARSDRLEMLTVNLRGETGMHVQLPLAPDLSPGEFGALLDQHATELLEAAPGPCRAIVVSLAVPVDPRTRQPVPQPESPFPAAQLDVLALAQRHTTGAIAVDNDVNWSAVAACAHEVALSSGLVLHIHLGHGLGGAISVDGRVLPGRRGAIGELGRMRAGGRSVTQRLGSLGMLQEHGYSIDVDAGAAALSGSDSEMREILAEMVANAIILTDPEQVVFSGPLIRDRRALAGLTARVAHLLDAEAPPTTVLTWGNRAPAVGARAAAIDLLRQAAHEVLIRPDP